MAKGYVVTMVSVRDVEAYKPYIGPTGALVEKHGGRYLVRGGFDAVIEGEVDFDRLVVLEFDSVEKARAFYDDPEYVEVRKIRHANSVSTMILASGYEPE